MTQHELHHPVTEESVREFVDSTAPSDATDADKDQRTQSLLQGAAANNAWRDSRSPDERLALREVPYAVHETEVVDVDDEEVGVTEKEDDINADA